DRRLVPRQGHLPAGGLRPRPRRQLARTPARLMGRRRRLLLLRDQDGLHRRGRHAGLGQRRPARARSPLPQLRQTRPPGRGAQPADERVHRRHRAGPDREAGGDRRPQERGGARAARPRLLFPPGAARGDDLRSLQVHRVRADRAIDGQGLRPAVPPDHGYGRRAPEQRLGDREPLVRAALLRAGARVRRGLGRGDRMSRGLVTGGSGFIGSHVVDKLADAGFEPRIYDLHESAHHEPGSVDTVVGDLFDGEALRAAMADCDAVVHLAAYADVGIVAEEPVDAEECNARGTLAVLEAARATDTRVVYGSTIWVYGASGNGLIDEEAALGLPDHLYTASKLAGEMYCTSYSELYDVDCTILRFGIPYGPRARPAAVIPIFVSKALRGEPLTIAGDGLQTRRFVYVEDLAEGVVAAVEHGAPNRVYNLAGDETVTIRELADVVSELVDDAEVVHTPGRNGDFGG